MTYGRGRRPQTPDGRDWHIDKLKARIAAGTSVPIQWNAEKILNQGENGTCVSAGILGACDSDDANHVLSKFGDADIVPFFLKIANHGDLPDGGAEVRDGLKAAKDAGYIDAYAAITNNDDLDDWLDKYGPVVCGSVWDDQMMTPAGDLVVPANDLATCPDGHCYRMEGMDAGYRKFAQSWGTGWGVAGLFRMSRSDFTMLWNAGGEAWAITQAAPNPTPPNPTPPAPPPGPAPGPAPAPCDPTFVKEAIAELKSLIRWFEKLL